MPADNAKTTLVEDRRRLLEHVLQVFQKHGGRVQLPIGMAAAEPWLLDSVDVGALLTALSAAASSTAGCIDLLTYCQRGARTVTAGSKAHSRVSSRRTSEAAGQDATVPQLQMPQLETGLSEAEIKDLAYLVFACNCQHEADILDSVRSQLDIDESRAAEVQRLLGLVHAAMRQQAGPLQMSQSWTASLQLPVCMLGLVLPRYFARFRSFVMWRDTLSHVLLATLAQSVKEGWCQDSLQQVQNPKQQQQQQAPTQQQLEQQLQGQGSGGGTAQQLMARLKAALRRLDVREADDFDEDEYQAASEAVRQQTQAIIQCTPAGWSFPWCLRVRVYEVLLRAVFDSLDEAEYVPDKDRYLQLLESRVRPLLGIAEPMHAAVLAWVHFRQYVITQAPQLLSETRGLLYKLASIAVGGAEQGAGERPAAVAARGASTAASGTGGGVYMQQDTAFSRGVGQAVVDWILERLSDYHNRLDALGGPESVAGLVDLLVFASASRGATEEEIGRALLEAVSLSVASELQRRVDTAAAAAASRSSAADDTDDASRLGSEALRCANVCRTARELLSEEFAWTRGFASQLPEAFPVALSVLQEAAGSVLLPWLATQPVLDDDACEALRCALDLEPRLMGPIQTAASSSCRFKCTARLFASVKPWNMPAQLQPLLLAWLEKQMSGFTVWVDRQLQQEDWRPLGLEQAHSASARELRRIALEALEALFGLQLPLPAATVRQYMQGIAGMMTRYLDAILTTLGSETVMIPPTPHLTRYKREVAVKQEEAESQLPGMPTQQPPASAASRKGTHFADSVRRIEDEPCASRVGGLTTPVLVVMMASLAYLAQTLQLLSSSVKQLRQQEQQARLSGSGSPAHLDAFDSHSAAAAAAAVSGTNPFLSDGDEALALQSPGVTNNLNGSSHKNTWSEGGGSIGSPMWGPSKPPLQQQQQLSGMQWRSPGYAADGSGGGSMGAGSGAGSEGYGLRDEQLGSLHETGQKLRAGLASVSRWLAVRVVWWEQRAAWCELLYRHRVVSCRLDWLLDALAGTLQDHISALPQEPQDLYVGVALELLQQAAKALERALLDGGPCRWFIPADVEHLREDVEELRKLFFRAKVPMQDIRTTLLGLEGVLKLMAKQTGPLIDAHRAARRAALLAGPAAPSTPPSAPFSATAAAGQPGMYSPVAAAGSSGGGGGVGQHSRSPSYGASYPASGGSTQNLGPLAAAKLANAGGGQGGLAGAAAGNRPSDRGSGSGGGGGGGFVHHSRHHTGGSSGGGGAFDDAASYSSYNSSSSPSWAAGKGAAAASAGMGGGAGAGAGAAGVIGGVGCMRRTAQDVAATGGDVESQEPILLRVLCHRADHTASKYLKDNVKVSKVKDESSVKETLKRGVTRFNPF